MAAHKEWGDRLNYLSLFDKGYVSPRQFSNPFYKSRMWRNLREEIIARELQHVKKEEIREDSRFVEDLNADSLDIVQIIMGIEEEFGIEIPEEASFQIKTVGEAHKAILKTLGK